MSDMGNLSSQHFNKIDGSWQRRPDRSNRDQQMHAMFSLRGLVACGGAAYLAFDRSSSIPLLIFVFFATNYVVGRRLGDVVTDSKKVQRFLHFTLPVVVDSLLYISYPWWSLMWTARGQEKESLVGLDTYASRTVGTSDLTAEDERAFDGAGIELCGGFNSGSSGSFRGKVYASAVSDVTGISLYQEWISPEEMRQMAASLQVCDPEKVAAKDGDVTASEVRNLAAFFQICAERGLGLFGWS